MKRKSLSAKEVEHLAATEARQEVPVGTPAGLYLVVQSSGAKSWAMRYRWHGKPRKLTLGAYPDVTLAVARSRAQAAVDGLDDGIDPAAVKAEEEARQPDTCESVADEWIARHLDVNVDWPDAVRILKNNIVKPWKHKLITEINRADVLRVLDAVVDRGAAVQANRTLAVLRAWFNWCVERGILPVSPANGIKPPTVETSRDRVLTSDELREVWTATKSLGYPFAPFTRLLLLLAQRRGEVSGMRWCDIDMDKAMWTLPKEQTKSGRVHDCPLSKAALEILKALPRFKYIGEDGKEKHGEYVWTTTSGRKPVNGFSKMKARIDTATLKRRTDAGLKENIAEWTLHDLRRSAATHMASAGVAPHILSAILNHTPGSQQGITSIYNRFRYTEERRAALQAWSEYVLSLDSKSERKAAS